MYLVLLKQWIINDIGVSNFLEKLLKFLVDDLSIEFDHHQIILW